MAVTQKHTVALKASAHCPTHSKADISIRDLNFVIDEPTERGGTNMGPTPTDAAIAALVGCTNVISNKCAKKLGIDIGQLTVNATAQFDRRGVLLSEEIDVPFASITLDITANGPATAEELAQVAEEAAKFCPLSKLFRQAGTEVIENWKSA